MSEINQENDESKQSDSTEIIQLKNRILELEDELKKELPTLPTIFISSSTQKGIIELKDLLWKAITVPN